MSDLDSATTEFMLRVKRNTPDDAKRVQVVLGDLLRWSEEHAWGVNFNERASKGTVRYCLESRGAPFWTMTPRREDGARLTLLTAAHSQFPEDLREEVRQVLARIDGREVIPDEVPGVGCMKLLWSPHRDTVLGLMTWVLNRLHGRVVAELTPA